MGSGTELAIASDMHPFRRFLCQFLPIATGTLIALACSGEPVGEVDATSTRPTVPAEQRATGPVIAADGSCNPEIITNGTSYIDEGNMPELIAQLKEAYCSANVSVCNSLSEAQELTFDHGDYWTDAPSTENWRAYCVVLADYTPSKCPDIEQYSTPNLQASCESFFSSLAKLEMTGPDDCLERMGETLYSADEVKHCLNDYYREAYDSLANDDILGGPAIPPLTQFHHDLMTCLYLPRSSKLTEGQPEQQPCLMDLAADSQDRRVCLMIDNHYETHPESQPACLAQLGE